MWFAAVCSLMWRTRPISRFERPARQLDEDLDLPRAEAVRQRRGRLDVRPELGGPAGERRQPDRLREPEREPELAARVRPVVARVPREQHPRVPERGVREPRPRAEPAC